jgi:hypothetical protein
MQGVNFTIPFEKLEIQKYRPPKDVKTLRQSHVPFTGSPCKHPYDTERLILVTDPFSTAISYFEFSISDVSYIEELPHVVDPDGSTVNLARVWIRKGRVALRCTPFIVEDTRNRKTPL